MCFLFIIILQNGCVGILMNGFDSRQILSNTVPGASKRPADISNVHPPS